MPIEFPKARVSLRGISSYSQSHPVREPQLESESPDAYDRRTWRSKMTVEVIDGQRTVVIPAFGMKMAIQSAAAYMKKRIKGQGTATWTKKFVSGIVIQENIPLWIDPDTVPGVELYMNSDGVRGGGKRVFRTLPQIPPGWTASFDVDILDPIITQDIFQEVVEQAGYFIGIGQFRPQNGGTNGRFELTALEWADNRAMVRRAA